MVNSLASISSEFSSNTIVTLIPELISLLYRFDATLVVINVLTQHRKDLAEEIGFLKQKLEKEKLSRNTIFVDSLSMEDQAGNELDSLKYKINKLEISIQNLQLDIIDKQTNSIIMWRQWKSVYENKSKWKETLLLRIFCQTKTSVSLTTQVSQQI